MYLHHSPKFLQLLYPNLVWHKPRGKKKIYLTFDDGPVPNITDFVLQTLQNFNAHATFFCVGENVIKHPAVFQHILENGHQVGNHTFNHINGWDMPLSQYVENIEQCDSAINVHENSRYRFLFRPPYGRLKRNQIKALSPKYQIIMWDVLTGDFDRALQPEKCLSKTLKYTTNGSIVIFHDSYKAADNLTFVLPRFLTYFAEKGYTFDVL